MDIGDSKMNRLSRVNVTLLLAPVLLALGCGGDDGLRGREGGRCLPGLICNPGLECLSDRCVRLPYDAHDAVADLDVHGIDNPGDIPATEEVSEAGDDTGLLPDLRDVSGQDDRLIGEDSCTPDCFGRMCGADGCGGSCGECGTDRQCIDGSCLVIPPECPGGECLVPGGQFWMGVNRDGTQCPTNALDPRDSESTAWEVPCHLVDTPSFRIDRDEVTNERYRAYLDAEGADCVNPSNGAPCAPAAETLGRYWCTFGAPGKGTHPVTCLTWAQADGYCRWAGKRLCTEAEWEKAARGTDGRLHPWGNEAPSCRFAIVSELYDLKSGCDTDMFFPVGSRPAGASPYGVLDMLGNAAEWTQDWFHYSYEGAPMDGSAWEVQGFQLRSVRGGSVRSLDIHVTASYRDRADPGQPQEMIGFRCCRSATIGVP